MLQAGHFVVRILQVPRHIQHALGSAAGGLASGRLAAAEFVLEERAQVHTPPAIRQGEEIHLPILLRQFDSLTDIGRLD